MNDYEKERKHLSNKGDGWANNSAVKAAIFVFLLMLSLTAIYVVILYVSPDSGGPTTDNSPTLNATETPANPTSTPGETAGAPTGTTEPPEATPEPPRFTGELRRGADNNAEIVTELQLLLIRKGYLNIPETEATGVFGAQTETAVRLFQKEHPAIQQETGIVDGVLFALLEEAPERVVPFTLRRGVTNPTQRVIDLQLALIKTGHLNIPESEATGNFGAQTEAAVNAFRRAHELPETGIVDNELFAKIVAAAEAAGSAE